MFAVFASLLFAGAFVASLATITIMLEIYWGSAMNALAMRHTPGDNRTSSNMRTNEVITYHRQRGLRSSSAARPVMVRAPVAAKAA
jgi:hypothetical protein